MRILTAVNQDPECVHALNQVARLAKNTWANITLLGIVPKESRKNGVPTDFAAKMDEYRNAVLDRFDASDCPYGRVADDYELAEIRPGTYEKIGNAGTGLKDLTLRITAGRAVDAILEEARECAADLIVLPGGIDSQYKIATRAECSVLVVKREKSGKNLLCFLDDDLVSQKSLEMITQMTALFNADLEIAGLEKKQGGRENVEKKLGWLLTYFMGKSIQPWVGMVGLSSLERFIRTESHWSLITMWMGEDSIIERLFSINKVATLLKSSRSSILLLR